MLIFLLLSIQSESSTVCVFLISTYTDGTPPTDVLWFYKWLEEATTDFRISKDLLNKLKYSVFGLGNSLYAENYNIVAKNVDNWFQQLGAKRLLPVGLGNENIADSNNGGTVGDFKLWMTDFVTAISSLHEANKTSNSLSYNDKQSALPGGKDRDGKIYQKDSPCSQGVSTSDCHCHGDNGEGTSEEGESEQTEELVDVEDLGTVMNGLTKRKEYVKEANVGRNRQLAPQAMITPILRQALTKQGYKLIGSHSGVKLCRWTKV